MTVLLFNVNNVRGKELQILLEQTLSLERVLGPSRPVESLLPKNSTARALLYSINIYYTFNINNQTVPSETDEQTDTKLFL